MDGKVKIFGKRLVFIEKERLSNVQKITSAENLRSRAFDDLVIELNINCNRKIAEVIFKTLLKFNEN